MTIDSGLRDIMLGATPNLRAFAISLTSNVDRADDLVWLQRWMEEVSVLCAYGPTRFYIFASMVHRSIVIVDDDVEARPIRYTEGTVLGARHRPCPAPSVGHPRAKA